jgi:beta-aspartyl-peptidase (threonine type)
MKSKFFIVVITIVFLSCSFGKSQTNDYGNNAKGKFTIVMHAGAGNISRDMPDSVKKVYLNALTEALNIGKTILEKGGTSLDAVEKVIRFLEDDPKFNAGKGAVFTSEGTHELDASIMNGKDLSCGSVAGVKHVKNPITLARTVMEKSPHVFIIGEGAEKFAKQMNIELVDEKYFFDQTRFDQWQKMKQDAEKNKKGTVGCVCLDNYGNIAAGTSTGGMTNKLPGRVGDSPIIGAGNYANNKTCGVSATGVGELFIRNTVAYNISAMMEYKNMSLKDAVYEMIHNRLKPGDGGVIAVDRNGNYIMDYNSLGMFRGAANSDGIFEIKIWE